MSILDKTQVLSTVPASTRLSEDFLENTKLRAWGASDLARVPGEYSDAEVDAMTKAYKRYRLRTTVDLPGVEELDLPSTSLVDTLAARRTLRSFTPEALTRHEVAALLSLSGGVTGKYDKQLLRAAPSAGGLFPVEIYLAVRNASGLEAGLYHYDWPVHSLARLGDAPEDERLSRVCCYQPQASECAVIVFLAGMVQRTVKKYGDRGLRYVFLDAGHLAQNLCLAATVLDLACMTTCGFYDDQANDLFGLDGLAESMLYVGFVGRPGVTTDAATARQD
jgi:SagB-type dehydrogenase family enzyme